MPDSSAGPPKKFFLAAPVKQPELVDESVPRHSEAAWFLARRNVNSFSRTKSIILQPGAEYGHLSHRWLRTPRQAASVCAGLAHRWRDFRCHRLRQMARRKQRARRRG